MSKENLIDVFVDGLDFDPLVTLADILDVTVDPPPLDDMWPDWQSELAVEVCVAMGEAIEPVTEHPDVQRLIGQVETLSQENKRLKNFVQNVADAYATGGDPDEECILCRGELQDAAEQILKGE